MKLKLILILIVFILPLFGCWDYDEFHDSITVSGIALDKGEEKQYLITIETVRYPYVAEEAPKPVYYNIEAESIVGGLRESISFTGRSLFLGHVAAIIISEELAKEGVISVLDAFIRDHEIRLTIPVFIAKESLAKDFLMDKALQTTQTGREINETLDYLVEYSGIANEIRLYQVYNKFFKIGICAIVPALKLVKVNEEDETFRLHGFACFDDDRLTGYILPKQVPFFASLINYYDGGVLEIEIPDDGYLDVEVLNSKTKYKIKFIDGDFHLYINIDIHFNIASDDTNNNFNLIDLDPEDIEEIVVKHRNFYAEEFIEFMRMELDCDVVGIEKLIRHKSYKNWKANKDKYDFFQDTIIHINTQAEYATPGILKHRRADTDG